MIDLRSDTVTRPTPAMRTAMAEAEVGDDVYGEDPTINRLQEMASAMLGKNAALFVPSGTMGNLASFLAHCGRGDEAILGHLSHTHLYEAGGISALGGIHPRVLKNQADGTLDPTEVEGAIRDDDPHNPISRLISLESTQNRCMGTALPLAYMEEIGRLARKYSLKLHLDGARIFNACVALGVDPAKYAAPFDSVTFCLSKGLCAPAGSLIVGDSEFIRRAHRARKMLGGGMRQAGVLAAAGIVALQTMVERLADDHMRARSLADALGQLPGIELDNPVPASNMVYFRLADSVPLNEAQLMKKMEDLGVLISDSSPRRFRLVMHYWIDDAALQQVLEAFRAALPA